MVIFLMVDDKIMKNVSTILLSCFVVFGVCSCRPTDNPTVVGSYDVMNITCVTNENKSNTSTLEEVLPAALDNIAMENSNTGNNDTEHGYITVNYTTQNSFNVHSTKMNQEAEMYDTRTRELPMSMIIAGPAAAFGIGIFLCLSYCCHSAQLNRQAKRLSIALYISCDENTENTRETKGAPEITVPRQQILSTMSLQVPRAARDNGDMFHSRRRSTLIAPCLGVPGGFHHKRGSSWSAVADQEILNLAAPRRHSTFIL